MTNREIVYTEWIYWIKGWFLWWAGGARWGWIMLPRMAQNLKLTNYFWTLPFNIFGLLLTGDNWNTKKQNQRPRRSSVLHFKNKIKQNNNKKTWCHYVTKLPMLGLNSCQNFKNEPRCSICTSLLKYYHLSPFMSSWCHCHN